MSRRRLMQKIRRATPALAGVLFSCAGLAFVAMAWTELAAGPTSAKRVYGTLDLPDRSAAALIALGDSLFHGPREPGTCAVCHGRNGVGTMSGPRLAGSRLGGKRNIDSIARVIRKGVYWPPSLGISTMPAYDGLLDREQIRALAAYVRSISLRGQN
jgi:mono/diheme cytochrome c family protein